jgi:glycosyltransferase involved in cell wall biosynthesis
VNNSIDTKGFEAALRNVDERTEASLREAMNIPSNAAVGLFCGGLNRRKHVPFLLDAAIRIRSALPQFHLLIVGDGPDEALVRKAAATNSWIHYVGPSYGQDRAKYFAISDVMLMPGLVGLAIVDAFCASLPLVTTDIPIHSPEIAYLEAGKNGLITVFDVAAFAKETVSLLRDTPRLSQMSETARGSRAELSVESMAHRFAGGIIDCLSLINK